MARKDSVMAKKKKPTGGAKRPPGGGSNGYEVGYGKPPQKNRFRKGVSGNPKGRRGQRRRALMGYNPKSTISEMLMAGVKVRQGEKSKKIPVVEALVRAHLGKALNGDQKATVLVIKILKELELFKNKETPKTDMSKLTDEELELAVSIMRKAVVEEKTPEQAKKEAQEAENEKHESLLQLFRKNKDNQPDDEDSEPDE